MFCGAFTGSIKPKLTTYCKIIVMPTTLTPGVLSCCSTEIIIGIMADARPVALAKPMWMTIRKTVIIASTIKVVELSSAKIETIWLASQVAAFVESSALPSEIPTPNSTTVPQLILFTVSFQCITPILGSIKSVIATMVLVEVSMLCKTFSVVQKNSRHSEITKSFNSSALILPISFSRRVTVACPPAISSISGGIICSISL